MGSEIIQVAAFVVGDDHYVIDIMRVQEIISPMKITPIREAPPFVEGVIDLRGTIIPIVDLRKRFGLPHVDRSRKTKFMIISVDGRIIGLVVDAVLEILRVSDEEIKPAPAYLSKERAPLFLGVCRRDERLYVLLNVKVILESDAPLELPPSIVSRQMDAEEERQ